MRKLASLRRVSMITPIDGADMIELAVLDGWQCVVKKGEFAVGDPAVYFEIDSFLPVEPRFEFLRKSSLRCMEGRAGFRLRSMRLRGQLSQGLAMPLAGFPELSEAEEGDDVTAALNVEKYEAPVPLSLAGKVRGMFPGRIPKTDEARIQNLPDWFEQHRLTEFEVSVKLDGSSMTSYWMDGEFGVCSRNLDLLESPSNTLWQLALRYRLAERLCDLGRELALQGEVIGEGIQKNNERIRGQDFYVFNIYDIARARYLAPAERADVLAELNGFPGPTLQQVPILGSWQVFARFPVMAELLAFADGPSLNPKRPREGIVLKGMAEESPISCKAISNAYLLRQG